MQAGRLLFVLSVRSKAFGVDPDMVVLYSFVGVCGVFLSNGLFMNAVV